jgi:hypothetical protein
MRPALPPANGAAERSAAGCVAPPSSCCAAGRHPPFGTPDQVRGRLFSRERKIFDLCTARG